MKICDLNTGSGRLLRAAKALKERWAESNEHWNDAASRQFEEQFLRPLAPEIQRTVAAVGRLAEVLSEAERDCDDHETTY